MAEETTVRTSEKKLDELHDRLIAIETDRKWLVIVGVIFFGLLGATNLISVPATADKSAREAAKDLTPTLLEDAIEEYLKKTEGSDILSQARKYAAQTELELARAQAASIRAREELEAIERNPARWPLGGYCVLAHGDCPSNFTRYEVHLRAIYMFDHSAYYLTGGQFGDSSVKWHNPNDRKRGENDWHGALTLAVCCSAKQ